MWFYQEVDMQAKRDINKLGPSRAGAFSSSKTSQGVSGASHNRSHKLLIMDGWSCAFTGICIYMFHNIQKQLSEEASAYRVPNSRNVQIYVDGINQKPSTDTSEVLGLHPNADITSVQPKEGGGGGVETRESIVCQEGSTIYSGSFPHSMLLFLVEKSLNRISWESTTLQFWYTELLERNQQFRVWINNDRPKVLWMAGVLLGEGVYVSGLFLEVQAKILYEQMQVIYIYVINTTASKNPRLYECPINRKPQRTDKKFVGSIDCETDSSPRHWTLRGVTLFCDIK
ncbi:hypothetical protein pipiens_003707 [Culex pipiens pipiens]|uniref:Dynein heavy chain C-terminal domain-containing protein n=1 Tax=Culex pipiens pipiens TaxID=38569 RepID=A0ABD1CW15_CULPP